MGLTAPPLPIAMLLLTPLSGVQRRTA